MMQGKQGFSKQKTIMIGVQVFIAALAAETDKDISTWWTILLVSSAVIEHLKVVATVCLQIIAENK